MDEPRFVAAYGRELAHVAGLTGPRSATSIFFGGGTPSLMRPATVSALLGHIDRLWPIAAGAEITLEANPSSVEASRFQGYRAAGVNRVSIGVQSLRDDSLKSLGRLHTAAEARAAIAIAARTFERTSFDLIYARPKQSVDDWRSELDEALSLAGDHLSLYQLTIEAGTPFAGLAAAGKLQVPPGELADELYSLTQDMTGAAGLPAYEVSNHAPAGAESQHNMLYWRYGEYVGVGPGAHGRILSGSERLATATERRPSDWLGRVEADNHALTEAMPLTRAEQADELLLMGLRLQEGLDLDRMMEIGGVNPSESAIRELEELNLIARDPVGLRIRATERGRFVLNEVVRRLAGSLEPSRHIDKSGLRP